MFDETDGMAKSRQKLQLISLFVNEIENLVKEPNRARLGLDLSACTLDSCCTVLMTMNEKSAILSNQHALLPSWGGGVLQGDQGRGQ